MKKRDLILLAAVLIPFSLGVGTAYVSSPSGEECQEIGQKYEQNSSSNVTMTCYPPGVLDVEPSDTVSENTDQQCFCRAVANGKVRIISISVASFQP